MAKIPDYGRRPSRPTTQVTDTYKAPTKQSIVRAPEIDLIGQLSNVANTAFKLRDYNEAQDVKAAKEKEAQTLAQRKLQEARQKADFKTGQNSRDLFRASLEGDWSKRTALGGSDLLEDLDSYGGHYDGVQEQWATENNIRGDQLRGFMDGSDIYRVQHSDAHQVKVIGHQADKLVTASGDAIQLGLSSTRYRLDAIDAMTDKQAADAAIAQLPPLETPSTLTPRQRLEEQAIANGTKMLQDTLDYSRTFNSKVQADVDKAFLEDMMKGLTEGDDPVRLWQMVQGLDKGTGSYWATGAVQAALGEEADAIDTHMFLSQVTMQTEMDWWAATVRKNPAWSPEKWAEEFNNLQETVTDEATLLDLSQKLLLNEVASNKERDRLIKSGQASAAGAAAVSAASAGSSAGSSMESSVVGNLIDESVVDTSEQSMTSQQRADLTGLPLKVVQGATVQKLLKDTGFEPHLVAAGYTGLDMGDQTFEVAYGIGDLVITEEMADNLVALLGGGAKDFQGIELDPVAADMNTTAGQIHLENGNMAGVQSGYTMWKAAKTANVLHHFPINDRAKMTYQWIYGQELKNPDKPTGEIIDEAKNLMPRPQVGPRAEADDVDALYEEMVEEGFFDYDIALSATMREMLTTRMGYHMDDSQGAPNLSQKQAMHATMKELKDAGLEVYDDNEGERWIMKSMQRPTFIGKFGEYDDNVYDRARLAIEESEDELSTMRESIVGEAYDPMGFMSLSSNPIFHAPSEDFEENPTVRDTQASFFGDWEKRFKDMRGRREDLSVLHADYEMLKEKYPDNNRPIGFQDQAYIQMKWEEEVDRMARKRYDTKYDYAPTSEQELEFDYDRTGSIDGDQTVGLYLNVDSLHGEPSYFVGNITEDSNGEWTPKPVRVDVLKAAGLSKYGKDGEIIYSNKFSPDEIMKSEWGMALDISRMEAESRARETIKHATKDWTKY